MAVHMMDRTLIRQPAAKKRFPIWIILAVVALALAMRANSLWMPHWRGDQAQYAILAMKLTHFGLDGYNLRRVAMGVVDVSPSKDRLIELVALKPNPDPEAKGAYIRMMESIGQSYYDEPLHMRAPLMPAALALSHKLLAGPNRSFFVLMHSFRWDYSLWRMRGIWLKQFWAVFVPLFFNLALIAFTGFLAWLIFESRHIAVYSALLLATNPLSIFLAHRVMTEDMATFWLTTSIIGLWIWRRHRDGVWGLTAAATSGICAGLAVLTNQRLLLGVAAIGAVAMLWAWRESDKDSAVGRRIWGTVRERFLWIFGSVFILVTAFWFIRVIEVYGEPLHLPRAGMGKAYQEDTTGWFAAVAARPHMSLLFALGVPMLCPLFALAYMSWPAFWRALKGTARDTHSAGILMLWCWILTFFINLAYLSNIFGGGNKEHRYFYFAYPAIAILAASVLPRMRQWAIPLLILNAVWGCWQAYPKIFADQMLF